MSAPRRSPAFSYRNGFLHADAASLVELAASVGTPFYCYSAPAMEARYRALADAVAGSGTQIAYAVKANGNLAVIEIGRAHV